MSEVQPQAAEAKAEKHFTRRRIITLAALTFALFATYRLFGVYTVRFGTCQFPITPAQAVQSGPPVFPARGAAAREARSIVTMSFNAEGHAALIKTEHLRELAETIREHKADVIGLQEVHRGTWQARFHDQAADLARLTGMNTWFGPSFSFLGGEFGNAILTRGRIIEAKVHPLPSVGEPRSLLEATIDIDGNRMKFFVTHLATWGRLNRRSRLEQIQCITEHVRRSNLPYVIVGDFNATPDTPEIRWVEQHGGVVLAGDPDPPTHKLTRQRLDYIFVDPGWETRSAQVLDAGPSDHYPLLAELQWEHSPPPAGSATPGN